MAETTTMAAPKKGRYFKHFKEMTLEQKERLLAEAQQDGIEGTDIGVIIDPETNQYQIAKDTNPIGAAAATGLYTMGPVIAGNLAAAMTKGPAKAALGPIARNLLKKVAVAGGTGVAAEMGERSILEQSATGQKILDYLERARLTSPKATTVGTTLPGFLTGFGVSRTGQRTFAPFIKEGVENLSKLDSVIARRAAERLAPRTDALAKAAGYTTAGALPGSINAAMEGVGQVAAGEELDPARIALAGGIGVFQGRPTRIGERIERIGQSIRSKTPVGRAGQTPAVRAGPSEFVRYADWLEANPNIAVDDKLAKMAELGIELPLDQTPQGIQQHVQSVDSLAGRMKAKAGPSDAQIETYFNALKSKVPKELKPEVPGLEVIDQNLNWLDTPQEAQSLLKAADPEIFIRDLQLTKLPAKLAAFQQGQLTPENAATVLQAAQLGLKGLPTDPQSQAIAKYAKDLMPADLPGFLAAQNQEEFINALRQQRLGEKVASPETALRNTPDKQAQQRAADLTAAVKRLGVQQKAIKAFIAQIKKAGLTEDKDILAKLATMQMELETQRQAIIDNFSDMFQPGDPKLAMLTQDLDVEDAAGGTTTKPPKTSETLQGGGTTPTDTSKTVFETPAAYDAQARETINPQSSRRGFLLPKGAKMTHTSAELKALGLTSMDTRHGTVWYDPKYWPTESQAKKAIAYAAMGDSFDLSVLGAGTGTRPAGATGAVVARDQAGTVVQANAVTPETVGPETTAVTEANPGAKVDVQTPEQVIAERQAGAKPPVLKTPPRIDTEILNKDPKLATQLDIDTVLDWRSRSPADSPAIDALDYWLVKVAKAQPELGKPALDKINKSDITGATQNVADVGPGKIEGTQARPQLTERKPGVKVRPLDYSEPVTGLTDADLKKQLTQVRKTQTNLTKAIGKVADAPEVDKAQITAAMEMKLQRAKAEQRLIEIKEEMARRAGKTTPPAPKMQPRQNIPEPQTTTSAAESVPPRPVDVVENQLKEKLAERDRVSANLKGGLTTAEQTKLIDLNKQIIELQQELDAAKGKTSFPRPVEPSPVSAGSEPTGRSIVRGDHYVKADPARPVSQEAFDRALARGHRYHPFQAVTVELPASGEQTRGVIFAPSLSPKHHSWGSPELAVGLGDAFGAGLDNGYSVTRAWNEALEWLRSQLMSQVKYADPHKQRIYVEQALASIDTPYILPENATFADMQAFLDFRSDPVHSELFDLLQGLIGEIKVQLFAKGVGKHMDFGGWYEPNINNIGLVGGHTDTVKILLHEGMHAATVQQYRADPAVAKKFDDLLSFVRSKISLRENYYGLTNGREFIAEALTDEEFRLRLKQIPYRNGNRVLSALKRFYEIAVGALTGEEIPVRTALDEVIGLTDDVLKSFKQKRSEFGKPYNLSTLDFSLSQAARQKDPNPAATALGTVLKVPGKIFHGLYHFTKANADRVREGGGQSGQYIADKDKTLTHRTVQYANRYVDEVNSVYAKLSAAEEQRLDNYAHDILDMGDSLIKLTPTEQDAYDLIQAYKLSTHMNRQRLGIKVSEGPGMYREGESDPQWVPTMMSDEARKTLSSADFLPDGRMNLKKEGMRNEFIDRFMRFYKGSTKKEAEKVLEDFLGYTRGMTPEQAEPLFNSVRRAQGMGLPPSMRIPLRKALMSHALRTAADHAYAEVIQSDPIAMRIIGATMDHQGNKVPAEVYWKDELTGADLNPVEPLGKNPDLKDMMDEWASMRTVRTDMLEKLTSLANSTRIGPFSAIRDLKTSLWNVYEILPASKVKNALRAAESALESSEAYDVGSLRRHRTTDWAAINDLDSAIVNSAQFFRKVSGRNAIEIGSRKWLYHMGKMAAEEDLGTKNQGWIEEFLGKIPNNKSREEIAQQVGTELVAALQGTYGSQGLPGWMLRASQRSPGVSMLKATFTLARWSVERYNNWYKHVWKKAEDGNITPLLKSVFGAMLTAGGYAAIKELITGAKPQEMTWKEWWNSGMKDTPYTVFSKLETGGFAGIASWLAMNAVRLANKEKSFNYAYPGLDLVAGAGTRLVQWGQAIQEGASPLSIFDLPYQIALDNMQILKAIAFDPTESGNREERIWRRVIGEQKGQPKDKFAVNPFTPRSQLKQAKTPGEMQSLVPALTKSMDYFSPPSAFGGEMRPAYPGKQGFYDFLSTIQGPEAAGSRMNRDLQRTELNMLRNQALSTAYSQVLQSAGPAVRDR